MGAPHGEQAVRAALIDAATELFVARGPSAVPIRAIAERAGVNHGLVHQYFGSKARLVTAVLDDLAAQVAAEIGGREPSAVIYAEGGPSARHGRILAHLLLEGAEPTELQSGFPGLQALIERYRAGGQDRRAAQERAAQVVALVMGWQLFEPFLTAAAGLPSSETTRRRLLDDAITRLLA